MISVIKQYVLCTKCMRREDDGWWMGERTHTHFIYSQKWQRLMRLRCIMCAFVFSVDPSVGNADNNDDRPNKMLRIRNATKESKKWFNGFAQRNLFIRRKWKLNPLSATCPIMDREKHIIIIYPTTNRFHLFRNIVTLSISAAIFSPLNSPLQCPSRLKYEPIIAAWDF